MPASRSIRFATFVLPILLFAVLALPADAIGPKGDLYFGYSRLGADTFYSGTGGLNGWELAGHLHMAPFFGAEVDVSQYGLGASSITPRTTTVLFGPRITVGVSKVHVFAHGLVGVEHSGNSDSAISISNTSMAIGAGGGADFRIAPFFAWRVTADYIDAPTESPHNGSKDRFSTGLVFRF